MICIISIVLVTDCRHLLFKMFVSVIVSGGGEVRRRVENFLHGVRRKIIETKRFSEHFQIMNNACHAIFSYLSRIDK